MRRLVEVDEGWVVGWMNEEMGVDGKESDEGQVKGMNDGQMDVETGEDGKEADEGWIGCVGQVRWMQR